MNVIVVGTFTPSGSAVMWKHTQMRITATMVMIMTKTAMKALGVTKIAGCCRCCEGSRREEEAGLGGGRSASSGRSRCLSDY